MAAKVGPAGGEPARHNSRLGSGCSRSWAGPARKCPSVIAAPPLTAGRGAGGAAGGGGGASVRRGRQIPGGVHEGAGPWTRACGEGRYVCIERIAGQMVLKPTAHCNSSGGVGGQTNGVLKLHRPSARTCFTDLPLAAAAASFFCFSCIMWRAREEQARRGMRAGPRGKRRRGTSAGGRWGRALAGDRSASPAPTSQSVHTGLRGSWQGRGLSSERPCGASQAARGPHGCRIGLCDHAP